MGGSRFVFSEFLVVAFSIGFLFFRLPNGMQSSCSLDVQPVCTLHVENTSSQSVILLYLCFFNHIEGSDWDVMHFIQLFFYQLGILCPAEIFNSSHNHKYIILFFPIRGLMYFFSDCTVYIILSEP